MCSQIPNTESIPNLQQSMVDILNNTISALIWAGLAFLLLYIRNRLLENKLRRGLENNGVTQNITKGLGIILKNTTSVTIEIREVVLIYEDPAKGAIRLNYGGEESDKDTRGFVTMPPFTDTSWYLHTSARYEDAKFSKTKIEILYPTMFGHYKQGTITATWLEHLNRWCAKKKPAS